MSNWTLKEKSTGELLVTVEGDAWKQACNKAFDKLAKKVNLPGFRKGQAPKALIEKQVSVRERQLQAIDDNANEWLLNALKEAKVEPISRPSLDIKSLDDEKLELVFTFAVMPEVKLGEYKQLSYDIEDVTVSDEELEAELNRMRETYAEMESKDGAADNGDTVNINYEGFKDGVAFEGGKADNYNLVLGSGSFIPGFEDQLVGSIAGEEKELNLTFPENYHAEDLKGAAVVFKVKVNEVKAKVLPELNDEFAKDVNAPGVETVENLKDLVRTRLESSKKSSAESKADATLFEKVSNNAEVELPDVLVEEEANNSINQLAQQIQQYGMSLDQYLKMLGKTVEDLRKDYMENAAKSVKLRLVLEAIAKAENLEATEEEIDAEFNNIAEQYKMDVAKVKELLDVALLKKDVINQKAYEFVKSTVSKK